MGKKQRIVKCFRCKCNNNVTEMLENNDYDKDNHREDIGYIYCIQCGNCIEISLK